MDQGSLRTEYSPCCPSRPVWFRADPSNRDGEEPDSPEVRAENAPESESRITDKRDEDGQEVPLLNLKQEVESEDDMEIDEDCEPNITGGSSPATYLPVSRRRGKRVSYKEQDSSSSSSSSPSPQPVQCRGRGHPRKQSSSATPVDSRIHQCVTCDEIFLRAWALSKHCLSTQPRHGKQCRRGKRIFINKSCWLKHKDSCDGCNFVVRNISGFGHNGAPLEGRDSEVYCIKLRRSALDLGVESRVKQLEEEVKQLRKRDERVTKMYNALVAKGIIDDDDENESIPLAGDKNVDDRLEGQNAGNQRRRQEDEESGNRAVEVESDADEVMVVNEEPSPSPPHLERQVPFDPELPLTGYLPLNVDAGETPRTSRKVGTVGGRRRRRGRRKTIIRPKMTGVTKARARRGFTPNSSVAQWKCITCDKRFSNLDLLKQHCVIMTPQHGRFCPVSDEWDGGRLIVCDECNALYHLGCLDPPLNQVPEGGLEEAERLAQVRETASAEQRPQEPVDCVEIKDLKVETEEQHCDDAFEDPSAEAPMNLVLAPPGPSFQQGDGERIGRTSNGRPSSPRRDVIPEASRKHECATCGARFNNLTGLTVHCYSSYPTHRKYCPGANVYITRKEDWEDHVRSCRYNHQNPDIVGGGEHNQQTRKELNGGDSTQRPEHLAGGADAAQQPDVNLETLKQEVFDAEIKMGPMSIKFTGPADHLRKLEETLNLL
ncbi:PHD finger protein 21A [Orchesella cincta]|uniref:PHD finger protein 21A n=1 Tax=Orchesella cincta TaxID=48709 RepID=A0A1D2MC45_ORCCI|nr:PHD finger protein 21A [Orchesella cincta]